MGQNAFEISMTSNKSMGPKKQVWPIRMNLSKPFRRQLTHYAEKFLNELLSNISLINGPTPIGSTKNQTLHHHFGSVYAGAASKQNVG